MIKMDVKSLRLIWFIYARMTESTYARNKRDFNYKALLDMFVKVKKLGQGGFGSVHLLKNTLNGMLIAAKFVDVSEYLAKADNIQHALKEARHLINLDNKNIINLENVFLLK